MHVTKGVDLHGLTKQITDIVKIVHLIYYEAHNHMIITATKWGRDSHRYAHENGRAIDLAPPLVDRTQVLYKLKSALGINYIALDMKTHFHVAFDPLGGRILASTFFCRNDRAGIFAKGGPREATPHDPPG